MGWECAVRTDLAAQRLAGQTPTLATLGQHNVDAKTVDDWHPWLLFLGVARREHLDLKLEESKDFGWFASGKSLCSKCFPKTCPHNKFRKNLRIFFLQTDFWLVICDMVIRF